MSVVLSNLANYNLGNCVGGKLKFKPNSFISGEILDTPGISNSLFNFPPSSKSTSSSSSSSSNPPRQRCDRLRESSNERLRESESVALRGLFDVLIAKLNDSERGSKRIK